MLLKLFEYIAGSNELSSGIKSEVKISVPVLGGTEFVRNIDVARSVIGYFFKGKSDEKIDLPMNKLKEYLKDLISPNKDGGKTMKKILSLILCGVLLVACGNNTKSEVKEEKKTEKTTETKESKPASTGVHTFDSQREIEGTNYIYNRYNYDRNLTKGARYYGPSTGENPSKNHAEFFIAQADQVDEKFRVTTESEFITKLLATDNNLFYSHLRDVVGSSYSHRIITINKETKKTINGIEYLNLEFKVDLWGTEEWYQKNQNKPDKIAFVNGYFTLFDGTDGGKVPFYAMQAWEDGAGEAAKAKALAVLEEVLTTVRKK